MDIKPLNRGLSFTETLFENYLIEGSTSFNELLDVYHKYKKENPDKTIILTLDDLEQTEYTSTHSTMFHDLDEMEDVIYRDLTGLVLRTTKISATSQLLLNFLYEKFFF